MLRRLVRLFEGDTAGRGTGRDPTEDAEAYLRAAAAIIALRECIGRRSREGNRDGGESRERCQELHLRPDV